MRTTGQGPKGELVVCVAPGSRGLYVAGSRTRQSAPFNQGCPLVARSPTTLIYIIDFL